MSKFPFSFVSRMENCLGSEADQFFQSLAADPITSIRFNVAKHCDNLFKELDNEEVPWCSHAKFISQRPVFTLDPNFHAGSYYVQESSSMFLYFILNNIFNGRDRNLKILDLCASPGGKSTAILDFLNGEGVLVSNEVIQNRVGALIENIMKWGYRNAIVTNNDASQFKGVASALFDCVVVDAPCSGEGLFRKDKNAIEEWSEQHVDHCALRQKRILSDAVALVNENGFLIYSTCTYNDDENINNVEYLMQEGFEVVEIPIDLDWGIQKIEKNGAIGYQFYPHKVKGEGFFIAVLKKVKSAEFGSGKARIELRSPSKIELEILASWIDIKEDYYFGLNKNDDLYCYNLMTWTLVNDLIKSLKIRYSGVRIGTFKKSILIPHHALALSNDITLKTPTLELNESEAEAFLRRELQKVESHEKGWSLATFNKNGIGWFKNLGNRINNYFPTELRIRMRK